MSWSLRSFVTNRPQQNRASAPIIGGILVVALAVVIATIVGTATLGASSTPQPAPTAAVDLTVDGETLRFTHESGETLNVRELSIQISVDGEPLDDQPPVPFFSASGFEPGPTGPFNTASDPNWEVGETASLTVAGTNSPEITSGSTVSVRISVGQTSVIEAETTV